MKRNPYERFASSDFILRDQLAVDRTILANERTLLAYIRTVLALVLAGATVIRLFEDAAANVGGWVLIGCGALVAGIGLWRTYRMNQTITAATREIEIEQQRGDAPPSRPPSWD